MNLKDRLRYFMQGRCGVDQLSRFLMKLSLILIVFSLFSRSHLVNAAIFILLGIVYWRMLSRDYARRSAENQRFLRWVSPFYTKIAGWTGRLKSRRQSWEQNRGCRVFKCPHCQQKVRVPRGHGKVEIRCPKCSRTFIRRS